MATLRPTTDVLRSCALTSRAIDESPIGWSIIGRRHLLVEVPLPWPSAILEAAGLPRGLAEFLGSLPDRKDPWLEALVPDPEYSVPGRTRVIMFDRDDDRRPGYARREFLVTTGDVTDLVRAWVERVDVGADDATEAPGLRDVIVCTHGSHDSCCGRFGAPLHRLLRDACAGPELRVWRGSHTGGHRFSPTLLDLPDGRSWGRLRPEDLPALVRHEGHPLDLRDRYRGLGSLPTFHERLLEAELLFEHGWSWLGRAISGMVVEGVPLVYPEDIDEVDDRAVVQVTATGLDGGPDETWEGVIERGATQVTLGECGDEPWELPALSVTSIRRVVPEPVPA